jgi:hypothetical protein
MLKRILTIAVLVAGISCFAASVVRIDISGIGKKIVLTSGELSKGMRIANPGWAKKNSKYYLSAHSEKLTGKWQKFSLTFTPDKDGPVNLAFMGSYRRDKGAKNLTPVWVAYDNITVTGTEAKNGDFESVNKKKLFAGWRCKPDNMISGSEDAQSGKNYIIAWHNRQVAQTLKVKKGQEVTITFYAKASEGPAKKKQ